MIVNPLAKDNRMYYTLSKKEKLNRNIYLAITTIIFIINAFLMYECLFDFSNLIGSIACGSLSQGIELILRMLPLIILNFALIHFNIYLRSAYKSYKSNKYLKVNSIISIVVGFIIILYIIISLITGRYHYLVEGYPSYLFPLDILLMSLVLITLSVLIYLYSLKRQENPNISNNKTSIITKILCIFKPIGYMIVLSSFAMSIYIPFVMDFKNTSMEGIYYNTRMNLVIYMAVLSFLYKIFIIDESTSSCKEKILFPSYLAIFISNTIVFCLYILSVNLAPYAPNMNSFGLLPVDYTASINVFFIAFFLNNVIGSLINFAVSLKFRKNVF